MKKPRKTNYIFFFFLLFCFYFSVSQQTFVAATVFCGSHFETLTSTQSSSLTTDFPEFSADDTKSHNYLHNISIHNNFVILGQEKKDSSFLYSFLGLIVLSIFIIPNLDSNFAFLFCNQYPPFQLIIQQFLHKQDGKKKKLLHA